MYAGSRTHERFRAYHRPTICPNINLCAGGHNRSGSYNRASSNASRHGDNRVFRWFLSSCDAEPSFFSQSE